MHILLIYHFFHPDQVVSARLFSNLAEALIKAGHRVSVFTSNRLIRGDTHTLPLHEEWRGVEICRFRRPAFKQGSNFGRLFNSAILQFKWLATFQRRCREFDAVVIGTDPQFAYLMFPFMRLMNRRVKLIHWAFDLYPEAILVNSPWWMKCLSALTKPFVPWAYRQVDVMADIGSCMQARLLRYRHHAICHTLTPWAFAEPDHIPDTDPDIRRAMFGDAKIGLLYSGTVGYAHDLGPFIELARECRRLGIDAAFCFGGYGNCFQEQTACLTREDINIRLLDFSSDAELEKRLAAADVHLISLRPGWEGIVVPSKFFAALAIGRPVLFSGPFGSCIAKWISSERLGVVMDDGFSAGVSFIRDLTDSAETLQEFRKRTIKTYHEIFSRKSVCEKWCRIFDSLAERSDV